MCGLVGEGLFGVEERLVMRSGAERGGREINDQ